jgi:hypothetical protein
MFICIDYVEALSKHVEAQYSQALFSKYPLPDGKVLNVSLDIPLCERFAADDLLSSLLFIF